MARLRPLTQSLILRTGLFGSRPRWKRASTISALRPFSSFSGKSYISERNLLSITCFYFGGIERLGSVGRVLNEFVDTENFLDRFR